MKILGISGSLRAASYNTALLRAAAQVAPDDVTIDIYEDLELLPPFNEDREDAPPAEVERLRAEIENADAVLFATPEYNTTMPGQVKQVVDWASRPHGPGSALWGKPVAVIGASKSMFGALWAQAELRKVLSASGARVLDNELAIATAHEAFDDEDQLIEAELGDALGGVVQDLADAAQRRAQMARAEA